MKPYEWPFYKNYGTKKIYIQNKLDLINAISDRGERFGQLSALEGELQKTKSQYGGHNMGVGKSCSEGIKIVRELYLKF